VVPEYQDQEIVKRNKVRNHKGLLQKASSGTINDFCDSPFFLPIDIFDEMEHGVVCERKYQ